MFGTDIQIWHCGQMMKKRQIIKDEIDKIAQAIQLANEDEDISPLFGRLDAIYENAEKEHSYLHTKQLEVFKAINSIDDSEYIDIEIPYLQGYLSGVRYLIQTDRSIFKTEIPFTLVIYSKSSVFLSNYELALCCLPKMKKVGEGAQKQYLVTNSISDILALKTRDNEELAVFAVCEKGKGEQYFDDFPVLVEISKGNFFYAFEDETEKFEIKTPASQIRKLLKKTII